MNKLNVGDLIVVTVKEKGDGVLLLEDATGLTTHMMVDSEMPIDRITVGTKITYAVIEESSAVAYIDEEGNKHNAFGLKVVGYDFPL